MWLGRRGEGRRALHAYGMADYYCQGLPWLGTRNGPSSNDKGRDGDQIFTACPEYAPPHKPHTNTGSGYLLILCEHVGHKPGCTSNSRLELLRICTMDVIELD